MATAYEISFKHEILNEFIASVDGLIIRKFGYGQNGIPDDVAALRKEIGDIHYKLPQEKDMAILNGYNSRLSEIRDYIQKRSA